MKKNTLLLTFLFINVFYGFTQGYSTGNIILSSTAGLQMTAKIEVNTSVKLTLTGPATRWFSLGFGAASMTANTDVVLCHSSSNLNSFDRYLTGFNAPVSDATQNWVISSNTVSGSTRTIIATRALNTGDVNDYVFSVAPSPISLIWARGGENNYNLNYHGGANRGVVASNFTLGQDDFSFSDFSMYPNPSSNYITIKLPSNISDSTILIYDYLGRTILTQNANEVEIKIATSNFEKGTYIVKIITDNGSTSKKLLVE